MLDKIERIDKPFEENTKMNLLSNQRYKVEMMSFQ